MKEKTKIYKEVWLVLEATPDSQVSLIPEEVLNSIKIVGNSCQEEVKLKYDMCRRSDIV